MFGLVSVQARRFMARAMPIFNEVIPQTPRQVNDGLVVADDRAMIETRRRQHGGVGQLHVVFGNREKILGLSSMATAALS